MKYIVDFLNEVKVELLKVVWPRYEEWVGSTIIVLILVVVFAVYLKVIDQGFSSLIQYIFKTYGF